MFKVHNRIKIVNINDRDWMSSYNGKIGYIFRIWKGNQEYPYEIYFDDGSVSWCFAEEELELISEA